MDETSQAPCRRILGLVREATIYSAGTQNLLKLVQEVPSKGV